MKATLNKNSKSFTVDSILSSNCVYKKPRVSLPELPQESVVNNEQLQNYRVSFPNALTASPLIRSRPEVPRFMRDERLSPVPSEMNVLERLSYPERLSYSERLISHMMRERLGSTPDMYRGGYIRNSTYTNTIDYCHMPRQDSPPSLQSSGK